MSFVHSWILFLLPLALLPILWHFKKRNQKEKVLPSLFYMNRLAERYPLRHLSAKSWLEILLEVLCLLFLILALSRPRWGQVPLADDGIIIIADTSASILDGPNREQWIGRLSALEEQFEKGRLKQVYWLTYSDILEKNLPLVYYSYDELINTLPYIEENNTLLSPAALRSYLQFLADNQYAFELWWLSDFRKNQSIDNFDKVIDEFQLKIVSVPTEHWFPETRWVIDEPNFLFYQDRSLLRARFNYAGTGDFQWDLDINEENWQKKRLRFSSGFAETSISFPLQKPGINTMVWQFQQEAYRHKDMKAFYVREPMSLEIHVSDPSFSERMKSLMTYFERQSWLKLVQKGGRRVFFDEKQFLEQRDLNLKSYEQIFVFLNGSAEASGNVFDLQRLLEPGVELFLDKNTRSFSQLHPNSLPETVAKALSLRESLSIQQYYYMDTAEASAIKTKDGNTVYFESGNATLLNFLPDERAEDQAEWFLLLYLMSRPDKKAQVPSQFTQPQSNDYSLLRPLEEGSDYGLYKNRENEEHLLYRENPEEWSEIEENWIEKNSKNSGELFAPESQNNQWWSSERVLSLLVLLLFSSLIILRILKGRLSPYRVE